MTGEAEPTPYGVTATPRALAELRLVAETHARAGDDAALLLLVDDLRRDDVVMWPHLWAPACAVAARRTGDQRAWPLLDEAIDLGFTQPELLAPDLEDAFADDAGWSPALERMHVPAADVVLLAWPDPTPQHPVVLDRIAAEREALLRDRVPADVVDTTSAWATARSVLTWVRRSWEHANDHVEQPDALDVLDRVAVGERFACVEYSIVLAQALNAVGIPARRVQGLQDGYHAGVGRGHVMSEAWVDDLSTWVLLDGQNGAYWVDDDGAPLGVPALVARHRERRPATMACLVEPLEESAQATWWSYFATVLTTGAGVSEGPFALSFQGVSVPQVARLHRETAHTHPPLDVVSVGVTGDLTAPRLAFATPHPQALGFRVTGDGWADDVDPDAAWPLRRGSGEQAGDVAVVTPYGTGHPWPLSWRA